MPAPFPLFVRQREELCPLCLRERRSADSWWAKMYCKACPRSCNIDRENKRGFCKSPIYPVICRAALHFWEEPCISGKNGSGTIFFKGCSLRCAFCQNYEISRDGEGKICSPERLAEIMRELVLQGAPQY